MPVNNSTLGEDVKIFYPELVNVYGAFIGSGTHIGPFVEIQSGVIIGTNCKISSHTFLCSGVEIGSGVFIGHGVMTTNDRYPKAVSNSGEKILPGEWKLEGIIIEDNVSIGSGVTILPGVTIGSGSLIAAGAVVSRSVPRNSVFIHKNLIKPRKDMGT